jgi:recombinational DNA repair protein (RecF pathway)
MSTLTDTTLTIRCPYCVVGTEFRPMISYKDGRFVCRECAHTVRPGVPEYKCRCSPCLRMERKDYSGE